MAYTHFVPGVTLPNDLSHCYASINGIRMHYVAAGHGAETVVLLHGFPEFWYSWRHQIAALAERYRVIAPDLRGYNETERRPPFDVATLQQDVAALIASLGQERVHLVGHDWGGGLAWLLAMSRPELLLSLTVCNAPHPEIFRRGIRRPRQFARSWYWLFFQIPWLPERVLGLKSYHILARTIIGDCRPGSFTREDVKAYFAAWRRQGLGGGIDWYRALVKGRKQVSSSPPMITTPTMLIWGERDLALGRELSEGTERFVTNLRVERLEGASHWVQQDAPDAVNRLLQSHLEQHGGLS